LENEDRCMNILCASVGNFQSANELES